ncbi:MAG: alanine dehydrogenase [Anaerolineales bacterium]
MDQNITIGFPRMMKEAGEKRVFLPEFIQSLAGQGAVIYIEEGYGSRSGYSFDDYRHGSERIRECSRADAYLQDLVMVLRSPNLEEFPLLRPGGCLVSMLHFPTRPKRVRALYSLDVNAISLDSIVNDNNLRMVENMRAVAWNGLEAAFDVLEQRWPGLQHPEVRSIKVLVLGTGMVGKHAIEAGTKLGNIERNNEHILQGGLGAVAISIGRNITNNPATMQSLFGEADILVDATQRRDTAAPVVPNSWIDWLPQHAIMVDLAVDPYTLDTEPPVVRGIEGIPQGNLDKYIFSPDDPDWGATIPNSIPCSARRTTVSCYSWPGIHPEACMHHYAQQLEPLMKALQESGYDHLSEEGDYFERALYRGSLRAWMESGHYEARPR